MITSPLTLCVVAALIVLIGYACRAVCKATWAAFRSPALFHSTTDGVDARSRIFAEFLRAMVLAAIVWGGTVAAAHSGMVTARSATAALVFFLATVVIAGLYYGLLYLGLKKRRAAASRHP